MSLCSIGVGHLGTRACVKDLEADLDAPRERVQNPLSKLNEATHPAKRFELKVKSLKPVSPRHTTSKLMTNLGPRMSLHTSSGPVRVDAGEAGEQPRQPHGH